MPAMSQPIKFEMSLEEAMLTQRAIRRLKPDPVDDALVLKLIELALKAPTGSNAQNWERTSTPKSGKARRVYLTPQLADALRELNRQRRVVALDDDVRAQAWLFPDKRTATKPMQYRRFYELFVPLAARLGLRGVTPHTLRHTYASLLFAQGKTMHFVQDQLGHHDPKFTASVYGHLIPGDRRGEVDFLDRVGTGEVRARSDG
jgi:integrase